MPLQIEIYQSKKIIINKNINVINNSILNTKYFTFNYHNFIFFFARLYSHRNLEILYWEIAIN